MICEDAKKAGLSECLPDPSGTACLRARAEQAEAELERLRAGIRESLRLFHAPGVNLMAMIHCLERLLEKPDA